LTRASIFQFGERMVTYEITAEVALEITDRYERYMREHHIQDLLRTGCFRSASFSRSGGSGRYRVRYEAASEEALERYLTEHAERLRADFAEHLPSGVRVDREVWNVLERWSR
jgi:hypothetical protein